MGSEEGSHSFGEEADQKEACMMDALTPLKTATDQELVDELRSRHLLFACVRDDKDGGMFWHWNQGSVKFSDAVKILGMVELLKTEILNDILLSSTEGA